MTTYEMQSDILDCIASGKKGIDLFAELASLGYTDHDLIHLTIEDMIWSGRIIEVEYELPTMEYRVKSFYLPGKTNIKIRKNP